MGTQNRQQFTDEQIRLLAENFDVVQLTKFHAGFDIRKHHEAARKLVDLRPDIEVYPYFSTKYWFDNNKWDGAVIDPRWLLRDQKGELVERDRVRDGRHVTVAAYVDLGNSEYRAWALTTLRSWLAEARYSGVYFDAATPIGLHDKDEIAKWEGLLGPDRVAAYNDGMRQLLDAAKELVGPERQVLYNGIAPNPQRGPGRNLDLLGITDGAMDERFCLSIRGQPHALEEDLSLLVNVRDRRLFMRTGYLVSFSDGDRLRFQRFCLGVFLLGWEPGRSYYQFNADYSDAQLSEPYPDVNVNLGRPRTPHVRRGDLAEREFDHGLLYVNLGGREQEVKLASDLTIASSGRLRAHRAGDTVDIPPHDAVFLLHSSFLPSP